MDYLGRLASDVQQRWRARNLDEAVFAEVGVAGFAELSPPEALVGAARSSRGCCTGIRRLFSRGTPGSGSLR